MKTVAVWNSTILVIIMVKTISKTSLIVPGMRCKGPFPTAKNNGVKRVATIASSKNKLENFIKEVEKNTGNELSSIIPFIGFILGIRYEDDRLNDREEIQNHINISIRTLLESICLITNSKNKFKINQRI